MSLQNIVKVLKGGTGSGNFGHGGRLGKRGGSASTGSGGGGTGSGEPDDETKAKIAKSSLFAKLGYGPSGYGLETKTPVLSIVSSRNRDEMQNILNAGELKTPSKTLSFNPAKYKILPFEMEYRDHKTDKLKTGTHYTIVPE